LNREERNRRSRRLRRRRWRRRRRRGLSEEPELVVVEGFLGRVAKYGPGVVDESEGMSGEGERVVVRVELGGETAVLGGDIVDVLSVTEDLENGVAVEVVVDPGLAGHEGIDNRQKKLGGLVSRVGLSGPYRK